MADLQVEGNFQAVITDYGISEMDTGAVAVNLRCRITAAFDPDSGEWADWTQYEEQHAEGSIWVIKKDNTVNQPQVEALCRYAGWDGSFDSITAKTWAPKPVRVEVKRDDYKGKTRFRINWIADHDSVPGGLGRVNDDRAKELQAKFGAGLRAVAGAFTHNAKPATNGNKPKAPPPPKAPPVPAAAPVEGEKVGADGIPF